MIHQPGIPTIEAHSGRVGHLADPSLTAPLLESLDAVTIPVPDLDAGLSFYRDLLGYRLIWRNDAVGQVGLQLAGSASELVLTTREKYEPNWKVESAARAADVFRANGGRVIAEPEDIPVGHVAIVEDPFGNVLVLVDMAKGLYQTDDAGNVTGVT